MTESFVPLFEPDILPADHRSGFVALVGRPNVGKSTLLNALLGQKIAIVSPKPQTTRNRLLGVYTDNRAQIAFFDTPGIHQPLHKLGATMVEAASQTIPDADVILFVLDASVAPHPEDTLVANAIQQKGIGLPLVMALNKIDLLPTPQRPDPSSYLELIHPTEWVPISATRGDNLQQLLDLIIEQLPFGPRYYPEDLVTDQQTRFLVAELIREAALEKLHEEVPHALAVVTNEFKERRDDMVYISATIFVERDTQKGIVIGKGGRMLKSIGKEARGEIERLLEMRVYLELYVKVRNNWRKREDDIQRLGYGASS
jgi:GTPase